MKLKNEYARKTGIILAFFLFLAAVSISLAQPVPRPIAVKLTPSFENLEIIITDTNLGVSQSFFTTADGEVMTDAQSFLGYRDTDVWKAVVKICEDKSVCTQTAVLNPGIFFQFDLSFYQPPEECLPIEYPPIIPCEGQGYIKPENCPVAEPCPDCPKPIDVNYDWLTFISGVGLTALFYYLIQKYFPYKGKMKIERRMDRYGKPYIVIMKWIPYTKKDGTTGYKWVLVQTIKES